MKKSNYKLPGLPSLVSTPIGKSAAPSAGNTGIAKTSGFNKAITQPINFGRASRAATKNPNSSSMLSSFLSGSTSGGIAGGLSGAAGFSGGIGSLISGLASLFGGGKTAPPALTAYQLPTSQAQTVYTGTSVTTPGVYGGPSAASPFDSESGQVVQAVKQALLNSSSLNDVIGGL